MTVAGLLGIDLGTSSVKVVITDERAVVLAHAVRSYPVEHPQPSWSETEPEHWWTAVVAATREAVHGAGVAVVGIGLSGQMHGVVLTDASGRPLRPAVLWSDSRAGALLEVYRTLPPAVGHRLANPLSPGMFGPILGFLARNEATVYDRARWALSPKDWIRFRLTGRIASEPSDACATLLYDIVGDAWDFDVADALELRSELLPPLLASPAAPAGTLLPAAAEALDLPAGLPVAAGGGDTPVAALGSALTAQGQGQLTIGTGIQIVAPVAAPDLPETPPVTHLYRAATEHGWYRMAAALNGGATLEWVRTLLGASWAELYATAVQPISSDDPIFLPHLVGERSPYLDAGLRGSWAYLDPRHDRSSLLRSALEGVALTTRAAWVALQDAGCRATTLRLAGGGTSSPAWRQMLADTLGVELQPVEVSAASGRGAALLAGRVAGRFDEAGALALVAPTGRVRPITPDPGEKADLVEERFRLFDRLLHAQRATRP